MCLEKWRNFVEARALRREALARCMALLELSRFQWRAKHQLSAWLAVARRAQAASERATELLR